MASHEELLAELPKLEKLSNAARLKLARKRRQKQLKKYQETVRVTGTQSNPQKKGPTRVSFSSNSVLHDLVLRNDVIEVKKLLSTGINPNISNADGLSPLHRCCIDNFKEMAEVLIEHGSDLNARDIEGWTPLHAAAACGNLTILNLLLSEGASLVAINLDDKMPVDVACDSDIKYVLQQKMLEAGYTEDVLAYIRVSVPKTMLTDLNESVAAGCSVNVQDRYGASALHIAASNGYIEVLKFLLSQPSLDINIRDKEGWTPFHAASFWGQREAMKMLAEKGADMDQRDLHDESAFAIAEDPEIRQYILELKGQHGKGKTVQVDETDHTHVVRTRRSSVNRASLHAKDEMSKESTKDEARMRADSLSKQDLERQSIAGDEETVVVDLNISGNGGVSLLHLTSASDAPDGGEDRAGAAPEVSQTPNPPPDTPPLKPAQKSALKSSSFSSSNSSTAPLNPSPTSGQFFEQRPPPRHEHRECCTVM